MNSVSATHRSPANRTLSRLLLGCDTAGSVLASNGGRSRLTPFGFGCAPANSHCALHGQWLENPEQAYLLGQGYRRYLPGLMLWSRSDSDSPFGVGGLNSYRYCKQDPVNYRDLDGHSGFFALAFLIAGAVLAGIGAIQKATGKESQGLFIAAGIVGSIGLVGGFFSLLGQAGRRGGRYLPTPQRPRVERQIPIDDLRFSAPEQNLRNSDIRAAAQNRRPTG
ncbi:RHS repeat-associated core domain-containing protein [Pseudomonas sp. KNUC1026]|uniref:RHS repeat-associated core domain-containing protein n=1 Tax=Pseudomonas sp. KNUC1026 TaxID=2893890 RepID=UPI001F36ACEB|nr:RHS repeat-associated core domain-containing protein [Pseudomonas sp. KNUC1026]UFH48070.1 hypothetical protein LN139_12625 [Pseudomonas sp. KNUC1026]